MRNLARILDCHLFYDGRGVLQLRRIPRKVSYRFEEDAALLSLPTVGFDTSELVNAVKVIGGKPKKAKKKITARYVAPRKHPLSPHKLGRNGVPRFLPEFIEDSSIKSLKEARQLARRRVQDSLVESVEVAFDALPVPFLEERDLCRVETPDWSGNFRLFKMTIPLMANGTSSIGYLKRVSPTKKQLAIRNRNRNRRPR